MSKNQKAFYKCNMCNNTIKITFLLHNYKKMAIGIKNKFIAVDGQGLANNYDRQIKGQTNLGITFVILN